MNASFTTLIATTLQNYSNKILDNIVSNNAALYFMKKAGNIQVVGGGRQFVEQLLWRANTSFAARASMDTILTPVTDAITAAVYEVKVVSGSIVIPTLDVAKNSGSKEKLIDYTKAKIMEAEVSMGEVLGDQMFTATPGANDMDSLPYLISTTPSTQTDVGDIDSSNSAYSYWRNYVYTTSSISTFNSTQNGLNAIDTSLNASTFGRMGPKLIITTKKNYTLYQLSLTSNARYMNMDLGDAGFKALQYATIPFVFDDNCPANYLYGIDTESIKLKVLAQGNLKQTAFQIATDQLASSALMYLFGNLTCNSRRTNFVIGTISG